MALGVDSVFIQEVFRESPRLTYRARSKETLGSTLEVFAEEEGGGGGEGVGDGEGGRAGPREGRHSTTGSSGGETTPPHVTVRMNGERERGREEEGRRKRWSSRG